MRDVPLTIRNPYHQFIFSHPNEGKRVLELVESGRRLLEAGHNNEARRFFLQSLSIYPHVIPALNNLALIALRDGDVSRAIDIVYEVFECDPSDPIAHSIAAQCWYFRESEPMVRTHVDTCLKSFIQWTELGDPSDLDYIDKAFPFVFQALLIAEDDAGIITLYQALPNHSWAPAELTWVGIANFNRGRINEAHIIWRKAAKMARYEPALIYATLAQHVLSEDLLPFTLDYELVMLDDDDFVPYPPSTLTIARLITEIFRSNSKRSQELLHELVEHEMPTQEYFLRRLMRNERLAPGLRMAAAVHLIWLGEDEAEIDALANHFDEDLLDPVDLPAYYLLRATIAQTFEDPDSSELNELIHVGRQIAEDVGSEWAVYYFADFAHVAPDLFDVGLNIGDTWDTFPSFTSSDDNADDDKAGTRLHNEPHNRRDKRGD